MVQTLCRSFTGSARKLSALSSKRLHEARNIAIIAMTVTATRTLISEVLDQIAQGNYVFVRKLKICQNYITLTLVQIKLSKLNI